MSDTKPILEEGHNCWRTEQADRVGFVIDGQAYFRAFRRALLQAEKCAVILAWDIHSEVLLERDDEEDDGFPRELGPFLNAVLDERPELNIHVLLWDFSMIYVAEREWRIFSETFRKPHPRLHLQLDDKLPASTSHHQKVIVIDDELAFAGGLDLSVWRWDDSRHHIHDARRVDPDGKSYGPYHDVQMCVTGDAARALGDLCAERWKRATGKELPRSDAEFKKAPWPDNIDVALEDCRVAIARTFAPYEPYPAVYEIEQLHLDIIASAERYLYFENQYFSSRRLTQALIDRLQEPDGPEIVIVMTQDTEGWLEESTMGLLRDRLFELLSEADKHGRLRLFYPHVSDGDEKSAQVYVHAKIVIADDRLLKIGSSNLSNRSMRLDSEVDMVIEKTEPHDAIRQFRDRLLAMHFGMETEAFGARLGEHANLRETLDSLVSETGHTLRPFSYGCANEFQRKLADSQLLDPDEPIDPGFWIKNLIPKGDRPTLQRRILFITTLILTALIAVLIIKWGPANFLDRESVATQLERIQTNPWAPLILMLVFFIAGLTSLSLNLILATSAVVLGPWTAFLAGLTGSYLSALAGFGLGHRFGKPLLKKLPARHLERLNKYLRHRGVISVIIVRLLPVGPYVMVNLVAGSSPLRFGVFNIGTILGMAPGMLTVVLLTDRLEAAIAHPGWDTILPFAAVVAVIVAALLFFRRSLMPRHTSAD